MENTEIKTEKRVDVEISNGIKKWSGFFTFLGVMGLIVALASIFVGIADLESGTIMTGVISLLGGVSFLFMAQVSKGLAVITRKSEFDLFEKGDSQFTNTVKVDAEGNQVGDWWKA